MMKHKIILTLIILLVSLSVQAQGDSESIYVDSQIAISRDSQVLAVSGRAISNSSAKFNSRFPIDFYDANTGNLISSFSESEDQILGLTLNSDGSLLAYNNGNGRLAVVDVQTNTEINVIVLGGFTSIGYPVFGFDDVAIAAFTTSTVEIHDALQTRNRFSSYSDDLTDEILGFDFSEDGTLIAYSTRSNQTSSGILVLLSVQSDFTLQLIRVVDAPSTLTVAIRGDGSQVASATNDGVLITNVSDNSQSFLPHNEVDDVIFSLDWSPDGSQIVAGGTDSVTVWDVQTGNVLESIQTVDIVTDIIVSPDGQYVYHTGGEVGIYRDGVPLLDIYCR